MGPGHPVGAVEYKGSAHVGPPLLGGELGLRARDPSPSQDALRHGDPPSPRQLTGEEQRLIEPALGLAARVERHRNQTVYGVCRQYRASLGEKVAQWTSQGSFPSEFKHMEQFSNRVPIERRGPGIREGWREPSAGLATAGAKSRGLSGR